MHFTQRMVLAAVTAGSVGSALTVIAGSAGSTLAIEAEPWNPPPGHRTGAEVRAEPRAAIASGEMAQRNEAYAGTTSELTSASTARHQQVRAGGNRTMNEHKFDPLYVGG